MLVLSDVTMFLTASYVGSRLGFHHWNVHKTAMRHIWAQGASICMWLIIFQLLGLYKRTFALSTKDELVYTVAALAIGTMPQMLLFTIYPGISTSRIALALSLAASIILVGTSRSVLHAVRTKRRIGSHRRVAIVGSIDRLSSAAEALELSDDQDRLLIAVEDIDNTIQDVDLTRDGELESIDWFRHARIWGCDTLILTEMVPPSIMPHLLEATARNQIRFAFAPPRIRCHSFSLSLQTDGQQALIVPSQVRACTPRAQLFKRIFDVTFGLAALVVLLPFMALAALAIYVESGRPIVFLQDRVGKGGRIFQIYKLRSMRVNAEAESGAVWAAADDPRRTKVGAILRRFSIDEFPQLFNVIRGDMSLVGPRPERPVFVDFFRKTMPRYDERHLVRPGITGWSQVHMKRVLHPSDAAEKLSFDLQYVESWSPFLDISVLFQTAVEFLFHRAA
ncbi:MAG TPA: sugar transferase [Candidatus Baltobacteraceae bacterium]|nr:sugar transferase [Candidatus Baltobacteraceae bacterium]